MAWHSVLALARYQNSIGMRQSKIAVPAQEMALQRRDKVPLARFQLRLPSTAEPLTSHQQFGDLVSFVATDGPSSSGSNGLSRSCDMSGHKTMIGGNKR